MATASAGATAQLLERALAYEDSLRGRTEGITWMLWGLVLGAIMFMYAGMGALYDEAPALRPLLMVLWVPWVLAGAALTAALWRTAALAARAPAFAGPRGLLVAAAWVGAILLGFALVAALPHARNPESAPVLALGVAWLALGATNLLRATPDGRRVLLAVGATLVVAGLALVLALPAPAYGAPDEAQARFLQDLLRGGLVALVPFAAGLWQALRG